MNGMRYARLLGIQIRASALLSMQYRADFLLEGLVEVFWTATAFVPLRVAYGFRKDIAGWTFGEALLVMGFFTLLEGVLEGGINPSLTSVVEHVRKGTLDFVLLKPADAQFLISTARFQPWRGMNVLTSGLVFAWAFHVMGHRPSAAGLLAAGVTFGAAVTVLYSLSILTMSAAFYVVRIDNLSYLFNAVFDAARWPVSVFRGVLRAVFTFVVPLALMTTYPALALLGKMTAWGIALACGGAALFFAAARLAFTSSVARYTSAGG